LKQTLFVAVPTLFITLHGVNAVLSWSTAAAGFSLQSTTNLANPIWLPVSGAIFTNGSSLMVTNGLGGHVRFFRLLNP
jgi:hypothetical protein